MSDREAERALFARVQKGDAGAREELVERFLPLAKQLARRYEHGRESLDDLTQVASLGLLKAIDGFDISRQTAFSSYAVPTILGELKRHFRDKGWAVRVPRGLQELSLRIDRATERMSGELNRSPTTEELAEDLGEEPESILEAVEAGSAYHALSLEAPGREGTEGAVLSDALGEEDQAFEAAESRATLSRLLRSIPQREREVLRLRFVEDLTQSEIGERIGVSQMQVSRLIRQALGRMRETANRGLPEEIQEEV